MYILLSIIDVVLNIVTLGAWSRAQGARSSGKVTRSYPKYNERTNTWH